MTDESHRQHAWHKPTLYAALVLLIGATVIGAVVAVSALSGVDWQPWSRTPDRERSVEIQPYALPPRPEKGPEWPSSPARRQSYHGSGLIAPADALRASRASSAAEQAEAPPTVIASGDLVAAIADGRKIFLPNPRGDCDLVGASGAMTRAIDDCFAGKAGR